MAKNIKTNIFKKITMVAGILRSKLTRSKFPFIVSWVLTNRCNYQCAYCGTWKRDTNELSTIQIFKIIDEMAFLGTKRISFTGGEPLLREDLGKILEFCKKKSILISVNSNGSLVSKKIKEILDLDLLNLSLDGPERVHDQLKGEGAFSELMNAINYAKHNNIKTAFFVTLSKLNLNCLNFFLDFANDTESAIFFQPAERYKLRNKDINLFAPPEQEYKKVISDLILEKRHNKFIANSLAGLRHLYHWPSFHPSMKCAGGILFCRIDANGDVKICGRPNGSNSAGNILKMELKDAFNNIKPVNCNSCWCASRIEFNYLCAFKLDVLINMLKQRKYL